MLPVVGADISQEWFDVDYGSGVQRYENTGKGFRALQRALIKHGLTKVRICMEATGLYFEDLAIFMYEVGHEVIVANPASIKGFSRCELRRAKTDALDARLIRQYGTDRYDREKLWQPPSPEMKKLKELSRRRTQLVNALGAEQNRLQAGFKTPEVIASIKRQIESIRAEIKTIEQVIKKHLADTPELAKLVKLADTVPGVSQITAVTIVAEVPECLWDVRSAAAYAGLAPGPDHSGKRKGKQSLCRIGKALLRRAMFFPAVTASTVSKNNTFSDFYHRLLARGKTKKQAIVAVARKLLGVVVTILRTGVPFNQHARVPLAA